MTKLFLSENSIINFGQRMILINSVFNLKNLIDANIDKNINIVLNDIYKNITKFTFTTEKSKKIHHWLCFFNRIYNLPKFNSINPTSQDYHMKGYWRKLFDKDPQLTDVVNKDYNIKFLMTDSDIMYNNEN